METFVVEPLSPDEVFRMREIESKIRRLKESGRFDFDAQIYLDDANFLLDLIEAKCLPCDECDDEA